MYGSDTPESCCVKGARLRRKKGECGGLKETRLERSQMTHQPFNGVNPLYCDTGMKKRKKKQRGSWCFIKKLQQNELHDCGDDSYLWPLDLNQTAPKMIR